MGLASFNRMRWLQAQEEKNKSKFVEDTKEKEVQEIEPEETNDENIGEQEQEPIKPSQNKIRKKKHK